MPLFRSSSKSKPPTSLEPSSTTAFPSSSSSPPTITPETERIYTLTTHKLRNTLLLSSSPSSYPSYEIVTPHRFGTRISTITRVTEDPTKGGGEGYREGAREFKGNVVGTIEWHSLSDRHIIRLPPSSSTSSYTPIAPSSTSTTTAGGAGGISDLADGDTTALAGGMGATGAVQGGREMTKSEFLKTGWSGHRSTFIGVDGEEYTWKYFGTPSLHHPSSPTPIAYYKSRNIFTGRKPALHIPIPPSVPGGQGAGERNIDLILLSFLIVEKKRRDRRQRAAASGGGGGGGDGGG